MPAEPIVVTLPHDMRELVPLFMRQRGADQVALRDALTVMNFEAMRKVGHGMAGAGASYGFDAVSDIGERLVNAARRGDVNAVRDIQHEFNDYMARVTVKYA